MPLDALIRPGRSELGPGSPNQGPRRRLPGPGRSKAWLWSPRVSIKPPEAWLRPPRAGLRPLEVWQRPPRALVRAP